MFVCLFFSILLKIMEIFVLSIPELKSFPLNYVLACAWFYLPTLPEMQSYCARAYFAVSRTYFGRKYFTVLILSSVHHARLYSWQRREDSFLIFVRARAVCEECYHMEIHQELVTRSCFQQMPVLRCQSPS